VSRFYSHLKNAVQILKEYKAEEPFGSFLKKYFERSKKYGSNDRKQIGHLCYCYFRQGQALQDVSVEERILSGLFLCSDRPNEMLKQLKPGWNDKAHLPVKEKLSIINHRALIEEVFPWKEQLSEKMDHEKFCESFFIQPDLFLRLRPGYENAAKTKLRDRGINFSEISATCLALPNAARIENIIELDKEAVVQDLNSQRTGKFFKNLELEASGAELKVWDCCAGSGGKSLLLHDIDPGATLTVSDIRESILFNLKQRFAKAGIKNYTSFTADLTNLNFSKSVPADKSQISLKVRQDSIGESFDLVICDVPCTGSGTWSRTPEQLYFFNDKKIDQYALLQKKIVSTIVAMLKKNGWLLYVTCSVFKKENEDVVEFMRSNSELELIEMELLKGYEEKADTMFAALFKRNL